jgi:hypothetical protein
MHILDSKVVMKYVMKVVMQVGLCCHENNDAPADADAEGDDGVWVAKAAETGEFDSDSSEFCEGATMRGAFKITRSPCLPVVLLVVGIQTTSGIEIGVSSCNLVLRARQCVAAISSQKLSSHSSQRQVAACAKSCDSHRKRVNISETNCRLKKRLKIMKIIFVFMCRTHLKLRLAEPSYS